jgi:hypothetical protein
MDELNVEELKQLVLFYNKRANDSELKNVELQLIVSRLKTQNLSFKSTFEHLNSQIEKLSSGKNVKKPLTKKD